MNNYSSSDMTKMFVQQLDTQEGKDKYAAAGAAYIRDRLRETSFARKILPPEQVTKADCQRSLDHDGLVKIVDIEPNSYAMAMNFTAEPDGVYITGKRFQIPFFTISSTKFAKAEQELLAYEMPITKVIEQNSVKDIQKIEDAVFIDYAYAAIKNNSAKNVQIAGKTTITAKDDIVTGLNTLENDEMPVGVMLMTKATLNTILSLTTVQLGEVLGSEVFRDGYKYNQLLGHKLVTTIKNDIIKNNEVWFFSEPDFLGKFFVLNNTKFYIDKRGNMVEWWSWEDIAMGFGNVRGIGRIYFGSSDPRA